MPSALFAPLQMRGLTLPNRIVVSSMCQYNSEHGSANDWHLMHLGQFAMGAAGLVITEATHVSSIGRITHRCLGLYSDGQRSDVEARDRFLSQIRRSQARHPARSRRAKSIGASAGR